MNWIDILILAIIGLSAYRAYSKGFIITIFNLVSLILTIVLAVQLYPVGSKLLVDNTKLDETIKSSVSKTLKLEDKKQIKESNTLEDQRKVIDSLPLPKKIKEKLEIDNNPEVYNILHVNNFNDYVGRYITQIVLNALSFLIIFIIILIALKIAVNILDIISKLPILNSCNKLLGLITGVILGVLRIWFVFVILTFMSASSFAVIIFESINNSVLASILYNNNVLLDVILELSKNIF